MRFRLLIVIFTGLSAPAVGLADQLFVQLGAYRDLTNANRTIAGTLGQVQQRTLANGLTRFRIVGLTDAAHAQSVLMAARDAGYHDAFIGGADAQTIRSSSMDIPAYLGPSDQRINAARAKVPPEQHGNIVFLDGKLVLKNGDTFQPLE